MSQAELLDWCLVERSAWDGQCLVWLGARTSGYAQTFFEGKRRLVTRMILADQLGVGIDDLDPQVHALHSCDRGHDGCVTPEHIHPGTHAENVQESVDHRRHHQSQKTHCKRGHKFTPENTYTHGGRRHCRACRREDMRSYRVTTKDTVKAS